MIPENLDISPMLQIILNLQLVYSWRKYNTPAGKITKKYHWRSVFLFNRPSKYDAVLSKIHSSSDVFLEILAAGTPLKVLGKVLEFNIF